MKINEAMSSHVRYIEPDTTLEEAARKMRELDCGFLPISDSAQSKLQGVITDRDITIRAVADGMDPKTTSVSSIASDKVLYCFADDDLDSAAKSMHDQHVYRLVVLNNKDEKQLCGILSLGDIFRCNQEGIAMDAAREILRKVA